MSDSHQSNKSFRESITIQRQFRDRQMYKVGALYTILQKEPGIAEKTSSDRFRLQLGVALTWLGFCRILDDSMVDCSVFGLIFGVFKVWF